MVLLVKKILCLFLIAGVIGSVFFSSHDFYYFKTGDINLDGKIDILDLNLLQHSLLQKNSLASIADQNGDNKVDVIDLQILFNRLEKKWQGKRTTVPVDFLQGPIQITQNTFFKGFLHNLFIGFVRDTEYEPSPFLFIPENRGHKITTELQCLTGFFCHAPPLC